MMQVWSILKRIGIGSREMPRGASRELINGLRSIPVRCDCAIWSILTV
jgi:hypothetical protein